MAPALLTFKDMAHQERDQKDGLKGETALVLLAILISTSLAVIFIAT